MTRARSSSAAKRLLSLAGGATTVDEAIRIIASRLLEGVVTPPTDLIAVADRLNVKSINTRELHFDGHLLEDDAGGFVIELSGDANEHRQRFTIAHELGHAVFATTGTGFPRSGEEVERLCNKIATELLMPADSFRRIVRQPSTLEVISSAARTFQTSLSATSIRCGELLNALVFGCSRTEVLWSRVPFIKRGSLAATERAIQKLVIHAYEQRRFRGVLILHRPDSFGWWHAESAKIDDNRYLFLLRRATQNEIEEQRESLIA